MVIFLYNLYIFVGIQQFCLANAGFGFDPSNILLILVEKYFSREIRNEYKVDRVALSDRRRHQMHKRSMKARLYK